MADHGIFFFPFFFCFVLGKESTIGAAFLANTITLDDQTIRVEVSYEALIVVVGGGWRCSFFFFFFY